MFKPPEAFAPQLKLMKINHVQYSIHGSYPRPIGDANFRLACTRILGKIPFGMFWIGP
jgi:hypothetical protein